MTAKQFYNWQAAGGTVAVNHRAEEPMVTQDVDFVVAADSVERAVAVLEEAGFRAERFAWSGNFRGRTVRFAAGYLEVT